MKYFFNYFLLFLIFISTDILARPISYPDGWTVMQRNNFMRHSLHVHYSPSINYSLGYRSEYWRSKQWQFHGLQINYLMNRINTPLSQANFYLKNAVGIASRMNHKIENKFEPNLFSGISIDWEDRRYYTSYENRINYNKSIDIFFSQKARIGLAPYIGRYGDLHTWIMLEIEHLPQTKNNLFITPMLRMFKGDYLLEAGLNINKELMFDFIKRF